MIIHRLEVESFGIIGNKLSVVFPDRGKIGIFGANESGKSTLFRAIEFALFSPLKGEGSRAPSSTRENLVTWGKKRAKVMLEFSSGGGRYRIERTIGVNSGHETRLYQLSNGRAKLLEHNVGEVERAVVEITGMDRNTFTKLIYIKQKELDALKGLGPSRREELFNKLMGMEEFDQADKAIMEDLREEKQKLERLEEKFRELQRDVESLKNMRASKEALERDLEVLSRKKIEKEERYKKLEAEVRKYEWLREQQNVENLLAEKARNLRNLEENESRRANLQGNNEKFQGEIEHYEQLKERYESDHKGLKALKDEITKFQATSEIAMKRLADAKEEEKKKQRNLWLSMVWGLIGIASLAFAISLKQLILLLGLVAFILAYRYHTKWLTASQQVRSAKKEKEEIESRISSLLCEHGFETIDNVDKKIQQIIDMLKTNAGVDNFDGLNEKVKGLQHQIAQNKRELNSLEQINFETEKQKFQKEINELWRKKQELERSRPESVEEIQYTEAEFNRVKQEKEKANRDLEQVKLDISNAEGRLETIEQEIEKLRDVEEQKAEKQQELDLQRFNIEVIERLREELKVTSQDLRARGIPHAEILINNILPTITDSRYFQLKIGEDLTFMAYSQGAGGVKEREVFSGGTQDQFLIALRLAFTQSILDSRTRADKYCLLMDECISSSDEFRKKGIFSVLDYMKRVFTQIFIIAHEDITNEVDYALHLRRGKDGFTEIASKNW